MSSSIVLFRCHCPNSFSLSLDLEAQVGRGQPYRQGIYSDSNVFLLHEFLFVLLCVVSQFTDLFRADEMSMTLRRGGGGAIPRRQAPETTAVQQPRTSVSHYDPSHHRRRNEWQIIRSDPLNRRRLGNRISDLELQLGQAQHELKNLKQQLAQGETTRKPPPVAEPETDVFEILVEEKRRDHPETLVTEHSLLDGNTEEHEKKRTTTALEENERLRMLLSEVASEKEMIRAQEKEAIAALQEELEERKRAVSEMSERLGEVQAAKEFLQAEVKRLRIQNEQWKKAADAAASLLSGELGSPVWLLPEEEGDDDTGLGSSCKWRTSRTRLLGDLWKKMSFK